MPIVKQRYGTAVSAEVLEESVSEATQQVLSDRGLRPAQQPKVDMVTENPTALTSDLEFKVELELLPDITLPDFSSDRADAAEGGGRAGCGRQGADADRQDTIARWSRFRPRRWKAAAPAAVHGEVLTVDFAGQDR